MLRAEAVELLARAMRQDAALAAEADAIYAARVEAGRSRVAIQNEIFDTFSEAETVAIETEARQRALGEHIPAVRAKNFGAGAPDGEARCAACGTALVPVLVERGERYCANCEEPLPR